MGYSYTPAYYSTLHDSITSICKSILPFNFKKRSLQSSEHKLGKLQSDNLKWQQDSFHQILNLMGLHKEGILAEREVSAFRIHLLDSLIVSPPEQEHPTILRDKLMFLQELLYAKCISEEEYHASKRPLLHRLAVEGVEIEARDIVVAGKKEVKGNSDEEWSVIDLKDERCLLEKEHSNSKNKTKHRSAVKQMKGAASAFSFVSYKPGKSKVEKSIFHSPSMKMVADQPQFADIIELGSSKENPFWDLHLKENENESGSVLMSESLTPKCLKGMGGGAVTDNTDKFKRRQFRTMFQKDQREGMGDRDGNYESDKTEEGAGKLAKKQWGFDRFRKWKRSNSEDDDTAPLPLNERSDSQFHMGSDIKLIKRKLHSNGSPSDFSTDKVLGDNIKKELSRIQTELSTTNSNLKFSDNQIEAISTTLPVDKSDLCKYFPKSWCDRHGENVLNVVKKEFKDHIGEMENERRNSSEKYSNSMRWTSFEDDENCHPNHLFVHQDRSFLSSTNPFHSGARYDN